MHPSGVKSGARTRESRLYDRELIVEGAIR